MTPVCKFILDGETNVQTSNCNLLLKSAVISFYECNGRLPFNIKKQILAAQWDNGIHSAELQDRKY